MPKFHTRVALLAAAAFVLLLPAALLAQKEEPARTVQLDEGIRVQVAPLWRSRQLPANGPTKLELTVADGPLLRMAVYFTVEKRRSPSDALQRVAEITGPSAREDRRFLVNGWPAVEATRTLDVPQTSQEKEKPQAEAAKEPHDVAVARFERTMTAIAAGDRAVIIEQRLYDTADQRLREAGRAVVDGVTFTRGGDEAIGKRALDDIDFVRKNLYDQKSGLVSSVADRYPFLTEVKTTPPVLAQSGVGEIAMAASYNGVKVAIVTNSGWARSADSGATYTGGNLGPASIANQGDPALTYGGKTDNFYLGYLGRPNGSGAAGTGTAVNGCTVSVDRSKDGQTYAWAGHARFCAATAAANQVLCAPDQEMIAADPIRTRARATTPAKAPKDQVYVGWRQFTATAGATAATQSCARITTGNSVVELSCSQDNGVTWTGPIQLGAGSDRPRLAVGPDGFVYVVYSVQQPDGSGGFWNQVFLDKYSSCKTGFVHQWGYPRTVVANARPAGCGASIPGLDRCSGDLMNSHTVTVSSFDPKGMVFVVYADGTFNGSDRVIAAMAPNGGFNVTSTHLLSDGTAGRKFLPWACTEGKNLYATWYDRRAATTAAPDSTDFYAGWLRLDQFGPTIHRNINLTGAADPQCLSGWPFGTQNQAMATSCPTPRRPGICVNAAGNQTALCDFTTSACPIGSTCQAGRGAPKYGDYNASTCAAGRLYAAWTSATTPAGSAAPAAGLSTFTRTVEPRVP